MVEENEDVIIPDGIVYLSKEKPLGKYRTLSKKVRFENGYGNDPATLALGVCEEAGELGKSVNWFHNPKYIHNPKSKEPHTVLSEMEDVLIYLGHLANALDMDIDF